MCKQEIKSVNLRKKLKVSGWDSGMKWAKVGKLDKLVV